MIIIMFLFFLIGFLIIGDSILLNIICDRGKILVKENIKEFLRIFFLNKFLYFFYFWRGVVLFVFFSFKSVLMVFSLNVFLWGYNEFCNVFSGKGFIIFFFD